MTDDYADDIPVTLTAYRAMRAALERQCADAEARTEEWRARADRAELAGHYSSEIERGLRVEIARLQSELDTRGVATPREPG